MKLGHYVYNISIECFFTKAEILHLIAIARRHYDFCCQQLTKAGLLNGLKNSLTVTDDGEQASWNISFHDADTLLKVLEMRQFHEKTTADMDLGWQLIIKLKEVVNSISAETARLYRQEAERPVEAELSKIDPIMTRDPDERFNPRK